ncbi:unnamed protein product, partial [Laminaria digitata]
GVGTDTIEEVGDAGAGDGGGSVGQPPAADVALLGTQERTSKRKRSRLSLPRKRADVKTEGMGSSPSKKAKPAVSAPTPDGPKPEKIREEKNVIQSEETLAGATAAVAATAAAAAAASGVGPDAPGAALPNEPSAEVTNSLPPNSLPNSLPNTLPWADCEASLEAALDADDASSRQPSTAVVTVVGESTGADGESEKPHPEVKPGDEEVKRGGDRRSGEGGSRAGGQPDPVPSAASLEK